MLTTLNVPRVSACSRRLRWWTRRRPSSPSFPLEETVAAERACRTSPLEATYLPKPTHTWSNLQTVERTEVKKGVEKQVDMIAHVRPRLRARLGQQADATNPRGNRRA